MTDHERPPGYVVLRPLAQMNLPRHQIFVRASDILIICPTFRRSEQTIPEQDPCGSTLTLTGSLRVSVENLPDEVVQLIAVADRDP